MHLLKMKILVSKCIKMQPESVFDEEAQQSLIAVTVEDESLSQYRAELFKCTLPLTGTFSSRSTSVLNEDTL